MSAEKERPQVPEISYPTDHFGNSNYADVSETPASAAQGEQVGMKKQGIDLLVMPCLLNDKLSPWVARSVKWLRRLVKRRN